MMETHYILSAWSQRLDNYKQDNSMYAKGYKDALEECINELSYGDAQSYAQQQQADSYLSSEDNHCPWF